MKLPNNPNKLEKPYTKFERNLLSPWTKDLKIIIESEKLCIQYKCYS